MLSQMVQLRSQPLFHDCIHSTNFGLLALQKCTIVAHALLLRGWVQPVILRREVNPPLPVLLLIVYVLLVVHEGFIGNKQDEQRYPTCNQVGHQ
jgi:hypothetical protein